MPNPTSSPDGPPMPPAERREDGERARTHVEFINGLSWAQLRDHLASEHTHGIDEDTIQRQYDVFTRRSRAEVMHEELHSHD